MTYRNACRPDLKPNIRVPLPDVFCPGNLILRRTFYASLPVSGALLPPSQQAAFRQLALKYHPDRQAGAAATAASSPDVPPNPNASTSPQGALANQWGSLWGGHTSRGRSQADHARARLAAAERKFQQIAEAYEVRIRQSVWRADAKKGSGTASAPQTTKLGS